MSEINGCPNPECHDPDCQGAMAHLPPHLAALIGATKPPPKTVHVAFLSTDEANAWNELKNMTDQAKNLLAELQTKRELFWAKIKITYNLHRRAPIAVDPKTTALTAAEEPTE